MNGYVRLHRVILLAAAIIAALLLAPPLRAQEALTPAETIKKFSKQVKRDPNNARAYEKLAEAYLRLKRYDEAIEAYRQVLRLRPDDVATHNALGNLLYELDRYEEAIESYKAVLRLNPDLADALYNLARAYHSSEKYREAADLFARELERNPTHPWAGYGYGLATYHLKEYSTCRDALDRYVKSAPNPHWYAYFRLGQANFELGEYRAAVAALLRAIELHPEGAQGDPLVARDAMVYRTLGDAYLELGEKENAYDAYKKMIPGFDDDYYFREGLTRLERKEHTEALWQFRRYLTLQPDAAKGNYRMAQTLYELKRYEEAVPYMEKAAAREPDFHSHQYGLALIYYYAKRDKQAFAPAKKAAELEPRDRETSLLLGRVSFHSGEYSEAIAAFERYLQLREFAELAGGEPGAPPADVLNRLAMSYAILGEYGKAMDVMQGRATESALREWLIVYTYCAKGIDAAGPTWKQEHPDIPANFLQWGHYKAKMLDHIWDGVWDLVFCAEKNNVNYAALKHYSTLYRIAADFTNSPQWSLETRKKILKDITRVYRKLPLKPVVTGPAKDYALLAQQNIAKKQWDHAYKNLQEALNWAAWWADGHYNAALVAAARCYPSADGVLHMKTYLDLEPTGPRASEAREHLRMWEAEIRQLEKEGYSVREGHPFIIAPDERY